MVELTFDIYHASVDLVELLGDFWAHRDGGAGCLAFFGRQFLSTSDLLKIRLLLLKTVK